MEQAARAFGPMMKGMLAMSGVLSKAFYQKYGKEAIPIITEVMSQCGVEFGKMMQAMAPAKSMKALGEQFNMMASMMDMKMEVVELSDDVLHFKMAQCPMGIEGTSKELCEALMSVDEKRVSTFLGQEMKMNIPKSIAAGDKECEVILSIK